VGIGIKWTLDDKKFLTDNYGTMDNILIGEKLNRKASSVKIYAFKKGLRKYLSSEKYGVRSWHPNRIAMMVYMSKAMFRSKKQYSMEDICYVVSAKPKHIYNTIYKYNLDIGNASKKFLSQKQLDYIKNKYPTMSTLSISLEIGISVNSVHQYARNLKVKKYKRKKNEPISTICRWSKEDELFLLNNYQTKDYIKIAKLLSKESCKVRQKIINLGLSAERLKIYQQGYLRFNYTYDWEIAEKLDYVDFWRRGGQLIYERAS